MVGEGKLYTLAGDKAGTTDAMHSVEVYDVSSGHSSALHNQLKFNCYQCRSCFVGGKLVLAGTWDSDGYNQLIIWDPATCSTTHTLRLQDKSYNYCYGVTECQGNLVVIADEYTAVGATEDILAGRADKVKLCSNYVCPNKWCGVCSVEDQTVVLVGGRPKEDKPKEYIYKAKLVDIINNADKGWQPVTNTKWSLGQCEIFSSDVAYINIQQ